MSELVLDRIRYFELEKLAFGAFQPVTGFMTEDEFNSVVERRRLPDGSPFPLPIVLGVGASDAERMRGAHRVSLLHEGHEVGEIDPQSVFTVDKAAAARKIYGTDDIAHPGVRFFMQGGDWFVGGPVSLKKRITHSLTKYELTPAETRRLFRSRGWKSVVGFQTRNVPHRAHEYLQRVALEIADGLFVQPLVGLRKAGDYTPEAVVAGYRALIDGFFPPERVVLGILTTSMRYAGPREAVFHAIIRRNYGCTHFVVGRDHAGVGSYYGKYEAHEATREFEGELGIEVLRLNGPFYCNGCRTIVTEHTCRHFSQAPAMITEISGTDIRSALAGKKAVDAKIIRPEIVAALADVPLFIEGEEM
ncbi:sulfate adenylyltransferase [Stappia sp. GBMRC 2046]|uniref:sulfate adenylyltransferase n=1 Tax=Stappia sediminis TaxID=2692190 RepID=A0A7X3LXQ5_9HYPH|nr:sulfate adenylyltransferase [Stappia sediminis]MXN67061.1 sulfate adenylyltransferase [Stappia sediminis]